MDKKNFQIYQQIRPRLEFLLSVGVEPSHIGQLLRSWKGIDSLTAYRWAALSQESFEKKAKMLGALGLFFLWSGAGGLLYLLGQLFLVFQELSPPVQELIGSIGGLFLWLGLGLSLRYSRLTRRRL